MFSNLIIAFHTVFPLCVLLGLGAFLGKKGMCGPVTQKEGNNIVFKALLPCLIFKNIFYTDFNTDFDLFLVVFSVGVVFFQYGYGVVLSRILDDDVKCQGAIVHSVFRTNALIFGMAVLINMYGSGDVLGASSIAMAVVVPIVNVLAVITLERYRGGKADGAKIFRGVISNPIIVATLIALVLRGVGISNFPEFVNLSISSIAALTTPMALLFLGASVDVESIKRNSKKLVICIFSRLVVLPAILVTIAALVGFRESSLACVLVISGGPTAVAAYTMSVSMDSDSDFTGQMVAFTTTFSCGTIFLWIFILMQLGLL